MITLEKAGLRVELVEPGEYYLGTRFDHAGVFRFIEKDGYVFADEWFDHSDPFRHDRVCGLSEEFVTVSFDGIAPGGLFCKPGVGQLKRPDDAPYDWFRLYEVAEPGEWEVQSGPSHTVFIHTLPGWYVYTKRICLTESGGITIEHSMEWMAQEPLDGFFYNHIFLTFHNMAVGAGRSVSFPWHPCGDWRSAYDNVRFSQDGIVFLGPVLPGTSVYCGNVRDASAGPEGSICRFTVAEGDRQVQVRCDRAVHHLVFWANDRVACPEPYIPIHIKSGKCVKWCFEFLFD